MITEKTVYFTDDGKKFSTRKAAEKHEEEYPKIQELKDAFQTIHDFCKWFRKERTDATDDCITNITKCPLYYRCKKHDFTGRDNFKFRNEIDNIRCTMPDTLLRDWWLDGDDNAF